MIKVKKRKILLLPGDGIGPEVTDQCIKIIDFLIASMSNFIIGYATYPKTIQEV